MLFDDLVIPDGRACRFSGSSSTAPLAPD